MGKRCIHTNQIKGPSIDFKKGTKRLEKMKRRLRRVKSGSIPRTGHRRKSSGLENLENTDGCRRCAISEKPKAQEKMLEKSTL